MNQDQDTNVGENFARETAEEKELELLDARLAECKNVRDNWCEEFVKARDALQRIYNLTEGSADGAPDASAHDKLCLEISGIILETLGREGVK